MEACRKGVKSQFLHKWEIFSSHYVSFLLGTHTTTLCFDVLILDSECCLHNEQGMKSAINRGRTVTFRPGEKEQCISQFCQFFTSLHFVKHVLSQTHYCSLKKWKCKIILRRFFLLALFLTISCLDRSCRTNLQKNTSRVNSTKMMSPKAPEGIQFKKPANIKQLWLCDFYDWHQTSSFKKTMNINYLWPWDSQNQFIHAC